MKKRGFYIIFFLFVHVIILNAQQIVTAPSQQANTLIQNLVGNNCVTISNTVSNVNGSVNGITSYGTFDNSNSNFPLENGLILSTGSISSAGNTLIGQDLSEGEIDWETDQDILDILGIDQTLNATSIAFDFTSVNDFISFKYLFASDEYQQEYPCNFSDVFAILIKPAGSIAPYENIAIIPNSESEISTSTIRPNIEGICQAQNEDYFNGYNLGDTNFNGRTNVLTASTDIIPGQTYNIKFVIADHIDQRFDSAVFIEASSFGGVIDLGPDQTICGSNLILDTDFDNPASVIEWFLDGSLLVGETDPTLQVSQSGTYSVEITIPSTGNNCTLSDSVEVEVIPFQQAEPIENIRICEPTPSDGISDFEFDVLKNDEIYDNLPSTDYTISYHLLQDDAQNNINAITGIYQNTEPTEIIFVRIESLNGDCLQIGSFEITVNEAPVTYEITVNICNNEISDIALTNLSILDPLITNFNLFTSISYYLSEDDAINQINQLTEYPDFADSPPYMIARVDHMATTCFTLEYIYFNYLASPDLGIDKFTIDACLTPDYYDNQGSTIYTYEDAPIVFNLEDAILDIQEVFPGANVRILSPILGNPRLFTLTNPFANLPIGISFEDSYCEAVISLELHKNLLFNVIEDEKDFYGCDDESNDGIVSFALNEIKENLSQDISNIEIKFFETLDDRENETNEINQLLPYVITTPTKELFITSYYNGSCSYDSKIMLNTVRAPEIEPQTVEACGSFNAISNTTLIDLAQFIEFASQGFSNVSVTFHSNDIEAGNGINDIDTVDVSGNSLEIYTRVTNNATGCFATTPFTLNIIESLEIVPPLPIEACDDNLDGYELVNLESVLNEFSFNLDDFEISFYETYENAIDDRNPIINPENHNTQSQTIFIRIQRVGLDCFNVIDFEVLIYNTPNLDDISDFVKCEVMSNNSSGFILQDKDIEVLSGQEGMEVFYFESEEDAINRTNPIDKTQPYQNLSNPQTVYIRIENEQENGCFKVASMQLEIRQAPDFNQPTDILKCDEFGTGFTTVALNQKIAEINANSTTSNDISFHLTPLNAQLGTNPLPLEFTSTANPQPIYVRVQNTITGCVSMPSFNINVLSLPEANYGKSIVACGNNYENSLQWNLTDIELEILEGRQFGIEFTYFENEEDLQLNTNPILSPENYSNISSPQTVYLKVINTVTGCYSSVPFELIINDPPEINEFGTFDVCDNQDNLVNLSDVSSVLLDENFNVLVSYHLNEADAQSNENAIGTEFSYQNTIENLYARVEYSTTHCYAVYPFEIAISDLPTIKQTTDLETCDDNFDGFAFFDLTDQNSFVIGGQDASEFNISYYSSYIDAADENNELITDYVGRNEEIIFVRLENNNTECFDIAQFRLIVHSKPALAVEDQVICLDNLPLVVFAETSITNNTYIWSTGETTPEIEILEIGNYSVTVTNQNGCTTTQSFNVIESESASIETIEKVDFSDPNNITITVSGAGNYIYSLNEGEPQFSNVFQNVPLGYNTVKIIDLNGCAEVTKEVLVIDAPKHMSPNNDGAFDTWHISGVETLPGTTIYIFDRYGKLLKQIGSNTPGWDGTYNGNLMPAGDYWFLAEVQNGNETFEVKGHFALRR